MGTPVTTVTSGAIHAFRRMRTELKQISADTRKQTADLQEVFHRNQRGLGSHDRQILALLHQMQDVCIDAEKGLDSLCRKLRTAESIRSHLVTNSPYRVPSADPEQESARFMGEIYDETVRHRRKPAVNGTAPGHWEKDCFFLDPDRIPLQENPDHRTWKEILDNLQRSYNFCCKAIPFRHGFPDFSEVALVRIPWQKIREALLQKAAAQPGASAQPDSDELFRNRAVNMHIADELAAEAGFPIPGLPKGYTAAQLAQWRKEHRFTWEESPLNGYLLVPLVVHQNIPHTGLVAVETSQTLRLQT